MPDPVVVFARFVASPGHEAEVRAAIERCQAPTRAEAACDAYDLHVNLDDLAEMMLYELWRSRADLEAHLQLPHTQELLQAVTPLVAEPVTVAVMRRVG